MSSGNGFSFGMGLVVGALTIGIATSYWAYSSFNADLFHRAGRVGILLETHGTFVKYYDPSTKLIREITLIDLETLVNTKEKELGITNPHPLNLSNLNGAVK